MSGLNRGAAKMGPMRTEYNADDMEPGDVKIYYLTPEEIEKKYGPVTDIHPKRKDFSLTRQFLEKELIENKRTIAWVSYKTGRPVEVIEEACKKLGIDAVLSVDQRKDGEEKVDKEIELVERPKTKIEEAMVAWPKDKFTELYEQFTYNEIAEKTGLQRHMVQELRKKYA